MNKPIVVPGERYEAVVPDTLDLAERARLAINVLTKNPDPKNYFRVWQNMNFGSNPPHKSSPTFDISPKFAESLPMMRVMCGSVENLEFERSMMDSLVSFIGEYGISEPPNSVSSIPQGTVNSFLNGRMMLTLMAWYQRDQAPKWLKLMGKLVDGLSKIAVYRGDYAYYPPESGWSKETGWTFTSREGEAYFSYNPPEEPTRDQQGIEKSIKEGQGHPVRALARWYTISNDKKALELARKVTNYLLKPGLWLPGEPYDLVGPEHGQFEGHFHGTLVGLRGILRYAIVTNNKRLKQFVRDSYTYARNFGISRIGWFPNHICPETHGEGRFLAVHCEGCIIADMTALAIKLSDTGVGDYWEDVDQYIRNQLTEQQVIREDLMEKVSHAGSSPEAGSEIDNKLIEKAIGGFGDFAGLGCNSEEVTGCCTGNCTQAFYYVWEGIVRYEEGAAQVNLLLNRASPWLDVDSYLPYEGKVVIKNKNATKVYVRIPYWVDKESVECSINKKESMTSWLTNYLLFEKLNKNDMITIKFPMVEATETYRVGDTQYKCHFKGNTLIDMSPRAEDQTVYLTYLREHYKNKVAPMKKVTRFISPTIIQW